MKRDGHENTAFFIGPEVEHTPAFSKKTLFVVGQQDVNEILKLVKEHKATHVFMGANHSFEPNVAGDYWNKTITYLLDRGYWVTLDYQAHEHFRVLKMLNPGIWQSRLFVPMLSVRIPHVQTSSVNLTIKIDDIDFKATNPGVWCLNHHEITDSNRFTDWVDYGTDEVLPSPVYADINKPVINLEVAREIIEAVVKNDASTGLDAASPSKLKPDPDKVVVTLATTTVEDAAAAYAEGAKEDPLGKEGSKKKVKK